MELEKLCARSLPQARESSNAAFISALSYFTVLWLSVLRYCLSGKMIYSLVFYGIFLFKAGPKSEIRYPKQIELWSKSKKIFRCLKK